LIPHSGKSEEALARMLMECSFCQRREVVYLNELELRSFEIRNASRVSANSCDAPSIWVEVLSNPSPKLSPARASLSKSVFVPRRNRTRIKTRILACIRRRGFQEEVAVCEDLSKGGIAFRSRNQYPEGTRLESPYLTLPAVAPSSSLSASYSRQPIATAGLFDTAPPTPSSRITSGTKFPNRASSHSTHFLLIVSAPSVI